jgi:hypothetical protein
MFRYTARATARSLSESPTLNIVALPKDRFKDEIRAGIRGGVVDLCIRCESICPCKRGWHNEFQGPKFLRLT